MGDLKTQPEPTLKTDLSEGYRDTEIGPLPEEWEVVRLEEVATFVMGQSPSSDTYNVSGSGLPFLQGKAEFGDVYPQPVKWCSSPLKVSPEGAILVSVRAPVGDVNIAPYECCIGRGLAAIQPTTEASTKYLFYCLGFHKNRFEEQSSGSTFKSINKGVLKNFLTPLPSLPQQKAIAHVLSTIRKAIESTEQVIEASRELKRSLMNHLFTYGPVPVDEAEQVPLKETEIGAVPEHWKVLRLRDMAKTTSGGTPSRKNSAYYGGSIPWVKSGELADSMVTSTSETITEEGLANSSAKVFPPGILLVAMYGATAGKVGILGVQGATNQAVCAVIPNDQTSPEYLFYSLTSKREELLGERYGGAQPNLSQTVLRNFALPIPPILEQEQIVNALSSVDTKIRVEETRKASLDILFKTLLHNLMTGKVRVDSFDLFTVEEMV